MIKITLSFFYDWFLAIYLIVSEADRKNDEEEKEEGAVSNNEPNIENDYRIGDTEDSKLFRKFLNSWESYFNNKREVSATRKANSNTTGARKRRNKRQNWMEKNI